MQHVYAHRGIHGNELADALAKQGAFQEAPYGIGRFLFDPMLYGDPMPIEVLWLWVATHKLPCRELPTLRQTTLDMSMPHQRVTPQDALPACLLDSQPAERTRRKKVEFGFASFNVCSLTGKNPKDLLENRVLFLRNQLISHDIHFTCLQETRARTSGVVSSTSHFRIVAEAAQGKGGTEIWIAKTHKGTGRPLLSARDLLVLHAEPEVLIARIRVFEQVFTVISAHGPHSSRPEDEIAAWWNKLTELCMTFCSGAAQCLLGIDANAHFTFSEPPYIGENGLETRANHAAAHFSSFLRRFSLFLPATFSEYHSGPTGTWRRSGSTDWARCDYVGLPLAWKQTSVLSQNIDTLDPGTVALDHVAVGVWVVLHYVQKQHSRLPRFDREKVRAMSGHQVTDLCNSLPDIPWETSVHEHGLILTKAISEWLTKTFPVTVAPPRRTYIQEGTWDLRRQRIMLRRAIERIQQSCHSYHLSIALVAWKTRDTLLAVHERTWEVLWLFHRKARSFGLQLHQTKNLLRKRLRGDRTDFLCSIAQEAIEGPPSLLHKRLRAIGIAGRKFQRGPQPLPRLVQDDGTVIDSFESWTESWRAFFAQQEDGIVVSPEELLTTCQQREPHCICEWGDLPTLTEMENAMRRTRFGTAFFEDGVPADVLHVGAQHLARRCFPLLLKHFAMGVEPVLFKGGTLVQAYKGKGPSDRHDSYRSLLISSTIGKIHHRLIRQRLTKYFEPYALPLQLGGLPCKSVTQASHVVHLFLDQAWCKGYSTAIIFVDIQQAFYRVLRQHAICSLRDMRGIKELFATMRLDDTAYDDFVAYSQAATALDEAGVSPHLQSLMADAMDGTWFVVKGLNTLTQTRKGTRPGDSFADILFAYSFARLLRGMTVHMKAQGLLLEIAWSGKHEPVADSRCHTQETLGPIWADDLTVMIQHESPLRLLQATSVVAGELLDRLSVAGMTPNLNRGKTEVMVSLRGKRSVALRRTIAKDGNSLTTTSRFVQRPLHVTGAYRHLGVWLHMNGSPWQDIRVRFAMAHSKITQYRSSLFGNKAMPLDKKVQLLDSLVLSAVHYNLIVWVPFRKNAQQAYERKFSGLIRRVAFMHFGLTVKEWTADELFAYLGVAPPAVQMHVHRLRYLQHLISSAPDPVWAFLQQSRSWWDKVQDSVQWFQAQRRQPLPFDTLLDDWKSWHDFIQESPQRWKRLVGRAVKHSILQLKLTVAWRTWHAKAVATLSSGGHIDIPTSIQEQASRHFCVRCAQKFVSNAAWSVHAFKVHNRLTPARLVVEGSRCEACMTQYATSQALVHHLTYSQTCYHTLRSRFGIVQPLPGLNSREEQSQRPALKNPPLVAEGPLQYVPQTVGCRNLTPSQQQQWDNWTASLEAILQTDSLDDALHLLKESTSKTTLHQDEVEHLYQQWSLWHNDCDLKGCTWQELGEVFRLCFSFEWFHPASGGHEVPIKRALDIVDRWLADQVKASFVMRPLPYKPVMIAHLFSGHRRLGDLQEFLERIVIEPHEVKVLSVDIVFSEELGNLAKPAVYSKFRDAFQCGLLVAAGCGPPCESWSRARLHGAQDGGPMTLRSAAHLQGLPALQLKEFGQVAIGNDLLGIAINLAIVALIAGAYFFLEHPKCPPETEAASIWLIPLVRWLLIQPGVSIHHVWQGHYGAPSPKPTSLMMCNAPPGVPRKLIDARITQTLPQATSIGKDSQGAWLTTRLKAYPPALCSVLAEIMSDFLKWRGSNTTLSDLPEQWKAVLEQLCVPLPDSARMGPDYHPTN